MNTVGERIHENLGRRVPRMWIPGGITNVPIHSKNAPTAPFEREAPSSYVKKQPVTRASNGSVAVVCLQGLHSGAILLMRVVK